MIEPPVGAGAEEPCAAFSGPSQVGEVSVGYFGVKGGEHKRCSS